MKKLNPKPYKPGEMVFLKDKGKYFVDDVPQEIKEFRHDYDRCKRRVKVFFAKHLDEYTHPAAEMRSWFKGDQPSEKTVVRAMIWDYDGYGDYSIKSGGESMSDRFFSSHLRITIADPKTGFDKDVVLLKKYGMSIEDVTVTPEELQQLEDLLESPARRKSNQTSTMYALLREILRWEKGVKTDGSGKKEWLPSHIEQMKAQVAEENSEQEIRQALERLREYAKNFENRQLNGGTGSDFIEHLVRIVLEAKLISEPQSAEVLPTKATAGKKAIMLPPSYPENALVIGGGATIPASMFVGSKPKQLVPALKQSAAVALKTQMSLFD